jgi:hypothetical protein
MMQNSILANWVNLSIAMSRLPNGEQAISTAMMRDKFAILLEWCRQFTDLSDEQLKTARGYYDIALEKAGQSDKNATRAAVFSAVEFLRAYWEPAEIVNMSKFGAAPEEQTALSEMTEKLTRFHVEKLDEFKWLIDWLENIDPIFPGNMFSNKQKCCFSNVAQKACYNNNRKCIFDPSISWIRRPAAVVTDLAENRDCCFGATLSSCSGTTLSCDCVSGNTGCDCKAPKTMCAQNNRRVAGSGSDGSIASVIDSKAHEATPGTPARAARPSIKGECVLDEIVSPFQGPLRNALDLATGRFLVTVDRGSSSNSPMTAAKDCTQTGFCPPHGGGCSAVC